MKSRKSTNKIFGIPGGAPPLRIYVSSNGKGKPARVDGKLSARVCAGYEFVEWSIERKRDKVKIAVVLRNTVSPYTSRVISRGWARGYFSLQYLKASLTIKTIRKLKDPTVEQSIDKMGNKTLVCIYLLDNNKRM